ncbi:MAG: helix-turn-helix domain-containing protein [Oscillospiraceae bacterium]
MKFGEKLSKLRRDQNYTQEQLADIFGVSRQTVSKWESGGAYPETEKIIRLSEMFGCTTDYLLKDAVDTELKTDVGENSVTYSNSGFSVKERKSEKNVFGMPLWHIGRNARGFIAVGKSARGVIAVGLAARGIISIGLASLGVFSIGLASVGLLSLGVIAIGFLAAGSFAAGVLAAGAVSVGIVSLGAIANGDFAIGALTRGKYLALGDDSSAMVALGFYDDSRVVGTLFSAVENWDSEHIKRLLDDIVPPYLNWAKAIAELFL